MKPAFTLVPIAFLAIACSSSNNTPAPAVDAGASTPDTSAPPSTPTTSARATFACTDIGVPPAPPSNWTSRLDSTTVERCLYQGRSLTVLFDGIPFGMAIGEFNGVGTYTADKSEGSYVNVRAQGAFGGNSPGDVTDVGTTDEAGCSSTCTIVVTEATVKDAPLGGTGSFVATVDCPKLTGGAVGCVTCIPDQPTIARISIAACNHDE